MKKKSWILIIIILFCIGLSILLLNIIKRINIDKLIIKEVIKPYGETITINDFLKEDIKNVKCDQDLENINLNLKDKYDFVFKLNNEDFRNKINSEVGKIY